jgi:hypothetical protein
MPSSLRFGRAKQVCESGQAWSSNPEPSSLHRASCPFIQAVSLTTRFLNFNSRRKSSIHTIALVCRLHSRKLVIEGLGGFAVGKQSLIVKPLSMRYTVRNHRGSEKESEDVRERHRLRDREARKVIEAPGSEKEKRKQNEAVNRAVAKKRCRLAKLIVPPVYIRVGRREREQ